MTKQPDEEWVERSGDDSSKVTVWIVAIMAAAAIVGLATLYAAHLPLGEYATKSMTER